MFSTFEKKCRIINSEKTQLKPGAIPTIFPWSRSVKEESVHLKRRSLQETRENLMINSTNEQSIQTQTSITSAEASDTTFCELNEGQEVVQEPMQGTDNQQSSSIEEQENCSIDYRKMYFDLLLEHEKCQKERKETSITKDSAAGTDEGLICTSDSGPPQMFSLKDFKHSDKIFYYTGFFSYEMLSISLSTLFDYSEENILIMNFSNTLKGATHQHKLSRDDQYFLVLIKLHQGFDYKHLSTLFNISVGTVVNIFISWINFMYIRLGSVDIWPHRDILLAYAPLEMKEKYPNVLGSLDATELFIQTSSLVRKSQTYSQYKNHNTLKGLIVIDGNGAIIFASALFTGSISDNRLLQDSGFIDVVQYKITEGMLFPGDIFLADKGFTSTEFLKPVNINIPVFRISKMQFSPEEVIWSQTISHERIGPLVV